MIVALIRAWDLEASPEYATNTGIPYPLYSISGEPNLSLLLQSFQVEKITPIYIMICEKFRDQYLAWAKNSLGWTSDSLFEPPQNSKVRFLMITNEDIVNTPIPQLLYNGYQKAQQENINNIIEGVFVCAGGSWFNFSNSLSWNTLKEQSNNCSAIFFCTIQSTTQGRFGELEIREGTIQRFQARPMYFGQREPCSINIATFMYYLKRETLVQMQTLLQIFQRTGPIKKAIDPYIQELIQPTLPNIYQESFYAHYLGEYLLDWGPINEQFPMPGGTIQLTRAEYQVIAKALKDNNMHVRPDTIRSMVTAMILHHEISPVTQNTIQQEAHMIILPSVFK